LYYFAANTAAIEMLFATRRACEVTGMLSFALCHRPFGDLPRAELSEEARKCTEGFLRLKKLGMGYEAAKTLANEAIAYGQQEKQSGARTVREARKCLRGKRSCVPCS